MPDQAIVSYFVSSSPVVQAVIVILLLASIASWTVIFQRGFALGRARRVSRRFEKKFWSDKGLPALFVEVEKKGDRNEGMPAIFRAGFAEYLKLKKRPDITPAAALEGTQRAMRIAASYEEDELENGMSLLATVGSTSPYIGLFGTVWGIMMSFHALGSAQQVTIAMVAPGISEALIATAMGLFAAIPAVIFYNRYVNKSDRILNRYDAFQEEFTGVLNHAEGGVEFSKESA